VLAMLLCAKGEASLEVKMWGYDAAQLAEIARNRENRKFLPGYTLPQSLIFEADDAGITAGAELIVSAVPCQFMRRVWTRLAAHVPAGVPVVSVAKGIENDTLLRPTEILAEILGPQLKAKDSEVKTAVLSGPTIADELARKLPATACVACCDQGLAERIQHTFSESSGSNSRRP